MKDKKERREMRLMLIYTVGNTETLWKTNRLTDRLEEKMADIVLALAVEREVLCVIAFTLRLCLVFTSMCLSACPSVSQSFSQSFTQSVSRQERGHIVWGLVVNNIILQAFL